ncbi:four helix bundle protein [candidate division BRC1 bacterium SM23_51]|nr:MAG: four helix bundle protein [candidate division BRC1 bacterium SM23_51]
MDERMFKERTKQLALRVVRLVEALPKRTSASVIGKQLLRYTASVGANYRAACRGRSTADVVAKLAIVEEEADEALYWMELLVESGIVPGEKLKDLMAEPNEIVAMAVASIKTLRARQRQPANPKFKMRNRQCSNTS